MRRVGDDVAIAPAAVGELLGDKEDEIIRGKVGNLREHEITRRVCPGTQCDMLGDSRTSLEWLE